MKVKVYNFFQITKNLCNVFEIFYVNIYIEENNTPVLKNK